MKTIKSIKTDEVKNQWQQALWYLINWNSFSLADVIREDMFYKFQTRLGEIEKEHGIICSRNRIKFINRFKKRRSYVLYTCIDKEKARKIFKKYN